MRWTGSNAGGARVVGAAVAAAAIALLVASRHLTPFRVPDAAAELGSQPNGADVVESHTEDQRAALVVALRHDGIKDEDVLRAIAKVPRHEFVPRELAAEAYEDRPLPIGFDQTISQPFIVAYMSALLAPLRGKRVLEVGTGSGYQAAVLAEAGAVVCSIEIVAPLSEAAAKSLARAGYSAVTLRVGDGYAGWPERAPFDRIIVTAAASMIPSPLIEQLAPGGRLVMPVEDAATGEQWIRVLDKDRDGAAHEQRMLPVRFVPMTGEAERR